MQGTSDTRGGHPPQRPIIEGMSEQIKADNLLRRGCYGVPAPDDEAEIATRIQSQERGFSGKYRDDLTGDFLVAEARSLELELFHSKGVWVKQPLSTPKQCSGRPPITAPWVDMNKGDEESPNYRSRLGAR